jgi:hypothetical protein
MATASKPPSDNTETLILMVGVGAAVLAYFLPAVVFKGTGTMMHDLAIIEKLPFLSALAFAALAFAVASRFMPHLHKHAETAMVIAIIALIAPALWGFISALNVWSELRALILQTAGTRTVKIEPGSAYIALLGSTVLLGLSLRLRKRGMATAAA